MIVNPMKIMEESPVSCLHQPFSISIYINDAQDAGLVQTSQWVPLVYLHICEISVGSFLLSFEIQTVAIVLSLFACYLPYLSHI